MWDLEDHNKQGLCHLIERWGEGCRSIYLSEEQSKGEDHSRAKT